MLEIVDFLMKKLVKKWVFRNFCTLFYVKSRGLPRLCFPCMKLQVIRIVENFNFIKPDGFWRYSKQNSIKNIPQPMNFIGSREMISWYIPSRHKRLIISLGDRNTSESYADESAFTKTWSVTSFLLQYFRFACRKWQNIREKSKDRKCLILLVVLWQS